MPRPCCKRKINHLTAALRFPPEGNPSPSTGEVILSLDELEALRLADLEGLYQEAAARSMGISRQTFGRIVEGARKKSADALLNGKTVRISGGNVRLETEGEKIMKIAVPTLGDQIDQHFGHCEKYAVFTIEGNAITGEESMASPQGCGCKSNIASVLAENGVMLLISGGIGNGAVNVLSNNGIKTVRGASGTARKAVESYLKGELADSGDNCHAHGGAVNGAEHVCSH
jgi:predicted DNA-binding protein (UPF0251 family)/predicted Fe-Mo cluster-binding NifX family protein